MRLSDKQWEKIRDLIPDGSVRADGRGRPWKDKREVLEGILWIVKTGARWRDLPKEYPPYQTCHGRFQQGVEQGVFDRIIEALCRDLQDRGGIDLSECFIDGTFSLAKKGGYLWERLSVVKAPGSWQSQTPVVLFYLSQSSLPALMKSP
jgi:transposase